MCSSDIPPASDPRLLILSLATPYPRRGNCLPQALVLVVPQPTQPFPQDSFLFLSGVSVHYRPQGCCPSLTPQPTPRSQAPQKRPSQADSLRSVICFLEHAWPQTPEANSNSLPGPLPWPASSPHLRTQSSSHKSAPARFAGPPGAAKTSQNLGQATPE